MIESVRTIVMKNERAEYETSIENLWSIIQDILISRWDKNCTPLHCLAHSLNPKYYSHDWLNDGSRPSYKVPPHMDGEISQGRKTTFRRLLHDRDMIEEVEEGFAEFSTTTGKFGGNELLRDKGS